MIRSLLLILYRSCFHGIEAATFEHAYGFKGFAPSNGCRVPAWTMDVLMKRLPFFIYF